MATAPCPDPPARARAKTAKQQPIFALHVDPPLKKSACVWASICDGTPTASSARRVSDLLCVMERRRASNLTLYLVHRSHYQLRSTVSSPSADRPRVALVSRAVRARCLPARGRMPASAPSVLAAYSSGQALSRSQGWNNMLSSYVLRSTAYLHCCASAALFRLRRQFQRRVRWEELTLPRRVLHRQLMPTNRFQCTRRTATRKTSSE